MSVTSGGTALKPCSSGGSTDGSAGSAGISMILRVAHFPVCSSWYHDEQTGKWATRKIIEIPAEPADPSVLPPLLQGFKAVPPLVTDINLSLDDRFLYVSCWGTGELRQYDVSDPFEPRLVGSVHIGGIVRRTAHPKAADRPLT